MTFRKCLQILFDLDSDWELLDLKSVNPHIFDLHHIVGIGGKEGHKSQNKLSLRLDSCLLRYFIDSFINNTHYPNKTAVNSVCNTINI